MVPRLSAQPGVSALLSLVVAWASALVFFFGTDAFYGTVEATLREALDPQTILQSDNVYLCTSLNGEGSDDAISAFFLSALLLPSLIVRAVRIRHRPGWPEFVLFVITSTPVLLLQFGASTCADIVLTLIVGHNLALATLILGWIASLTMLLLSAVGASPRQF